MARSGGNGGESVSRRAFLCGVGAVVPAVAGCIARGEDSGLTGEVLVDGSNTLLPHAAAVAEEFQWRNNRVQIPVYGSGTGAGFQRFCAGETHVQNASREILDDEAAQCESSGVEYVALETALDGLAVFVHAENDWCDCLTVEELDEIWRSGSDVETWADVRADWPDEEIDLYGRDTGSGTFDYFTEAITGEIGAIRSDYSASADTNVIVRGVRGNQYALGFGGAGYYYENEEELSLVGIDDGDGCVEPTLETIESGEYTPLTRPMFAYVNLAEFEREAFREFVRFYFEEVDDRGYEMGREAGIVEEGEELTWTGWAARRVGYYAVPDETIEEERARVEELIG